MEDKLINNYPINDDIYIYIYINISITHFPITSIYKGLSLSTNKQYTNMSYVKVCFEGA